MRACSVQAQVSTPCVLLLSAGFIQRHMQVEEKFYSFICWRGQIGRDLPGEINGTANHGSCCRGDRRSPGAVPRGCSSFKSCIILAVTVTERGKSHRWTRTPDSCIKACQGRFMPTRPPPPPIIPQHASVTGSGKSPLISEEIQKKRLHPALLHQPRFFIQPSFHQKNLRVENDTQHLTQARYTVKNNQAAVKL